MRRGVPETVRRLTAPLDRGAGGASACRVAAVLALALATALGVVVSIATLASPSSASGALGWSHWLCSPAALRAGSHAVGHSHLIATLLTAVELHWPHFLPIVPALATLVYLRAAGRAR